MKEFFDSLLEGHPGLLEAHPDTARLLETCYKGGFVNGMNMAVQMMEKVHEEMFGGRKIKANER